MTQLEDRVAIVTGASKGIGKAIARAFAAAGAHVVMAARSRAALEAAAGEIAGKSGSALPVTADVSVEEDIVSLFRTTMDRHGRLDILVNNAGITLRAPTDQIALRDWQKVIDTNLTGAFLCSREALKIMKQQRSGRIINVGSISSITPRPNGAAYAATKLALEGLTRSIALDYREYNIAASIIHLGATATSWMKVPPEKATGPEYHLQLDDVGRLAAFMASLPAEANMFETTILPVQQRSFVGRG
ncbi:MAG TPA: SDR family oxidoreductase [Xanthobacteraceae bacterium]|jgi:NAD(P)-dependent dehydrogenase (short-subunit alcohol dehydrogenase family)